MRQITVLGGGNGAMATAAHMSLKGHKVRLYNRSYEKLLPIIKVGGIRIKGVFGENLINIEKITDNIEEAILGSEVIILVVPSTGHEFYGSILAKFLKDGQILLLNPGHTGGALHMATVLKEKGLKAKITICETSSLTYICRNTDIAEVTIYGEAKDLPLGVFPSNNIDFIDTVIKELYLFVKPARNVLETSLMNINAIMHPPGMILNAAQIERTEGDFYFYYDGTTDSVAKLMQEVDIERLKILKAANLNIITFQELFYKWGYTTKEAFEKGSIYDALKQSAPNRWIKSPKKLKDRYLDEDIGYGLVPMSEIGALLGVQVPAINSLIKIASVINGIDYREQGLNLKRLGLEGISFYEMQNYLYNGSI